MKKLIVLSGAGVSAESGLKTFRESGGLWENYDIMEVASIDGWIRNPDLVREFYNARRKQLLTVSPNAAHMLIAQLEEYFQVQIITQNVDDLHERAGSSNVLHLHGELLKVRSTINEDLVYDWHTDLSASDLCELGAPLRPHVVWFGEAVPMIEDAIPFIMEADIFIVVGTSLQVYPAAGLIDLFPSGKPAFYIDPGNYEHPRRGLRHLRKKATEGMKVIFDELVNNHA